MKSPVLFIVFNRPETTRVVFERIRIAQPPRLYISADGPRANHPTDTARCESVRQIVSEIDWDCEVHSNFRSDNLGCKLGVSSGIDWFFNLESEGIILEDDVLPQPTFFDFCDEMLNRCRDDPRVFAVSGCNLISSEYEANYSYFYSRYCHVWGWATWRRAWSKYDVTMNTYPRWLEAGQLASHCDTWGARAFWRRIFDSVHRGQIDTWDYQWLYCCWKNGGLSIIPANNLTSNLGFDETATHTAGRIPDYVLKSSPQDLKFPLCHPPTLSREIRADRKIDKSVFGLRLSSRMKNVLRWLLRL